MIQVTTQDANEEPVHFLYDGVFNPGNQAVLDYSPFVCRAQHTPHLRHIDLVGVCHFLLKTKDPQLLLYFPLDRSESLSKNEAFLEEAYRFHDETAVIIGPLSPIWTRNDNNSLVHAVSLGIWGVHDFKRSARIQKSMDSIEREQEFYAHRLGLQQFMNDSRNSTLLKLYYKFGERRFAQMHQFSYQVDHKKPSLGSGSVIMDEPVPRVVVSSPWQLSGTTALSDDFLDISFERLLQDVESDMPLSAFHVYCLANVVRRPIIVYANKETAGARKMRGIYLPTMHRPEDTYPFPLTLLYVEDQHGQDHITSDKSGAIGREGDSSASSVKGRFISLMSFASSAANDEETKLNIPLHDPTGEVLSIPYGWIEEGSPEYREAMELRLNPFSRPLSVVPLFHELHAAPFDSHGRSGVAGIPELRAQAMRYRLPAIYRMRHDGSTWSLLSQSQAMGEFAESFSDINFDRLRRRKGKKRKSAQNNRSSWPRHDHRSRRQTWSGTGREDNKLNGSANSKKRRGEDNNTDMHVAAEDRRRRSEPTRGRRMDALAVHKSSVSEDLAMAANDGYNTDEDEYDDEDKLFLSSLGATNIDRLGDKRLVSGDDDEEEDEEEDDEEDDEEEEEEEENEWDMSALSDAPPSVLLNGTLDTESTRLQFLMHNFAELSHPGLYDDEAEVFLSQLKKCLYSGMEKLPAAWGYLNYQFAHDGDFVPKFPFAPRAPFHWARARLLGNNWPSSHCIWFQGSLEMAEEHLDSMIALRRVADLENSQISSSTQTAQQTAGSTTQSKAPTSSSASQGQTPVVSLAETQGPTSSTMGGEESSVLLNTDRTIPVTSQKLLEENTQSTVEFNDLLMADSVEEEDQRVKKAPADKDSSVVEKPSSLRNKSSPCEQISDEKHTTAETARSEKKTKERNGSIGSFPTSHASEKGTDVLLEEQTAPAIKVVSRDLIGTHKTDKKNPSRAVSDLTSPHRAIKSLPLEVIEIVDQDDDDDVNNNNNYNVCQPINGTRRRHKQQHPLTVATADSPLKNDESRGNLSSKSPITVKHPPSTPSTLPQSTVRAGKLFAGTPSQTTGPTVKLSSQGSSPTKVPSDPPSTPPEQVHSTTGRGAGATPARPTRTPVRLRSSDDDDAVASEEDNYSALVTRLTDNIPLSHGSSDSRGGNVIRSPLSQRDKRRREGPLQPSSLRGIACTTEDDRRHVTLDGCNSKRRTDDIKDQTKYRDCRRPAGDVRNELHHTQQQQQIMGEISSSIVFHGDSQTSSKRNEPQYQQANKQCATCRWLRSEPEPDWIPTAALYFDAEGLVHNDYEVPFSYLHRAPDIDRTGMDVDIPNIFPFHHIHPHDIQRAAADCFGVQLRPLLMGRAAMSLRSLLPTSPHAAVTSSSDQSSRSSSSCSSQGNRKRSKGSNGSVVTMMGDTQQQLQNQHEINGAEHDSTARKDQVAIIFGVKTFAAAEFLAAQCSRGVFRVLGRSMRLSAPPTRLTCIQIDATIVEELLSSNQDVTQIAGDIKGISDSWCDSMAQGVITSYSTDCNGERTEGREEDISAADIIAAVEISENFPLFMGTVDNKSPVFLPENSSQSRGGGHGKIRMTFSSCRELIPRHLVLEEVVMEADKKTEMASFRPFEVRVKGGWVVHLKESLPSSLSMRR